MPRGKSKKRVPHDQGASIRSVKKPRVSPGFTTGDAETPVWLVGDVELDGPFGWQDLEKDALLAEVLPKIQSFETMTWGDILGRNSHAVKVGSLCKEARKRLQVRKLDDVEQLVSLRLTGIKRVWGIRTQRALRFLWWDPEHKVCPSAKKHT
jgi:hypothetical protein